VPGALREEQPQAMGCETNQQGRWRPLGLVATRQAGECYRWPVDANGYSHYSLFRTVEDAFGLGSLGREDAKSQAFAACNFDGGCRP
jgi:hypothetical protein